MPNPMPQPRKLHVVSDSELIRGMDAEYDQRTREGEILSRKIATAKPNNPVLDRLSQFRRQVGLD